MFIPQALPKRAFLLFRFWPMWTHLQKKPKTSWFTSCLCKGDNCNAKCTWDNCKKIATSRSVDPNSDITMYNCDANCKAEETAMDKDGMLSRKMCSNDKDCGLGKKCIPTPLWG